MSADNSGSPSLAPTPGRKEKKRVGWHAGSSSMGGGAEVSSISPSPAYSPPKDDLSPGAPDAFELSRALSRVLTEEQQREDTVPEVPHILRPRPVLRRNTSYDVAHAQEEADKAEQTASPRQVRSINDARTRADNLAVSLGSHSAPGSRRNSDEMDATFRSLAGRSRDNLSATPRRPAVVVTNNDDEEAFDEKDEDEDEDEGLTMRADSPSRQFRRRKPHSVSPPEEQNAAANLVKSYKERDSSDLYHRQTQSGFNSGASTPQEVDPDFDYVPRPKEFRKGILSALLKLQDLTERQGSGSSGHNTPTTTPGTPIPGTPLMSPRSSPPGSRSASRAGRPKANRSSSMFKLHRSTGSASSLALTELMKSSSMFAAPGSSNITDRVADKIKKDFTPKSKKEQMRITVHIAGVISRHRYLLKLCRALMMYGAPTHRLEEYMIMSARVLEIEGQFLYLPSCMIISFDDSATHTTEVKLVRIPQGIDLGRLRDVHDIYKNVVHDELGVEEATRLLDEVLKRPAKFRTWFRVFLYGVASACVAPFAFQGRWIDLPFAFILGCIVGVLQLVLAPSNELYAHVFEVTAAIITSFLARAVGSIQGGKLFCFSALAQSSIALILPGYMVLCSSLELQSHNIVAGSVRMVHALIYTLFLGYGITIGSSLYGMMDSNASSETTCEGPLHRNWYFLFVPAFTLCLCLVNQAKWKQIPVMLVMALAGFCVNSYSSEFFRSNTQMSNMLGALTVGILANLYSRLGRHMENARLDIIEWWEMKIMPRFSRARRNRFGRKDSDNWSSPSNSDPESRAASPGLPQHTREPRKVGYSLAAAAMLPAIFVQVPSGLAAGGSLLAGITSANAINDASAAPQGNLDGTAFNVLLSVIQIAIGITVGLFMSALIVYPLGKRRSGLFSF